MLKVISKIGDKPNLFLLIGLVVGLLSPNFGSTFAPILDYILGTILFISFLKIDAEDILSHFKKPGQLLMVIVFINIIVPLLLYGLFYFIDKTFATAVLFLFLIPSGVSVSAVTSIVRGDVGFSTGIVLLSNAAAMITLPVIFSNLSNFDVPIDIKSLSIKLALMLVLPFLLSQIVRKLKPEIIKKSELRMLNGIIILLLSIFIMSIAAKFSSQMLANIPGIILPIIGLFIAYILAFSFGYIAFPKLPTKKRISVAVNSAYTNNGLAIVLAFQFLPENIAIIILLTELHYVVLIVIFQKISLKLQGLKAS